jgi:hypothetical protein
MESSGFSEESVIVHQITGVLSQKIESSWKVSVSNTKKSNQMQAEHKYLNKLRVCILAVVLILAAVGALRAKESPSRICDGENGCGCDLFYFFGFPLSVFGLPITQIHLPTTSAI